MTPGRPEPFYLLYICCILIWWSVLYSLWMAYSNCFPNRNNYIGSFWQHCSTSPIHVCQISVLCNSLVQKQSTKNLLKLHKGWLEDWPLTYKQAVLAFQISTQWMELPPPISTQWPRSIQLLGTRAVLAKLSKAKQTSEQHSRFNCWNDKRAGLVEVNEVQKIWLRRRKFLRS